MASRTASMMEPLKSVGWSDMGSETILRFFQRAAKTSAAIRHRCLPTTRTSRTWRVSPRRCVLPERDQGQLPLSAHASDQPLKPPCAAHAWAHTTSLMLVLEQLVDMHMLGLVESLQ